jgi:hypothetical protein
MPVEDVNLWQNGLKFPLIRLLLKPQTDLAQNLEANVSGCVQTVDGQWIVH